MVHSYFPKIILMMNADCREDEQVPPAQAQELFYSFVKFYYLCPEITELGLSCHRRLLPQFIFPPHILATVNYINWFNLTNWLNVFT